MNIKVIKIYGQFVCWEYIKIIGKKIKCKENLVHVRKTVSKMTFAVMGFSFVDFFSPFLLSHLPLPCCLMLWNLVFLFLFTKIFSTWNLLYLSEKILKFKSAAWKMALIKHIDVIWLRIVANHIFKTIRSADKLNIVFPKLNTLKKWNVPMNG